MKKRTSVLALILSICLVFSSGICVNADEISVNEVTATSVISADDLAVVKGSTYRIISKKTVELVSAKNTKTVKIKATVKINGKKYKIVHICADAFTGSKIRTVILGKNIKTIDPNAFRNSKVKSVQLYSEPAAETKDNESILSLWNDNAQAKEKLVSYMKAITDKKSADFIPVENRVAVFDLDGTLFCETDPNYFDYTLLVYRVLEDPDYKDKASDFEKETALKIVEQNETGASFSGLEVDHGKAIASAFKGMTLKEFNDYIQKFKELPMPSYTGMKRGEGWYKPMLQIVEYLQANDFTVYVVSGTDRFIVRGIVDNSPLNIPMGHIIGSDETLVATNQGDIDGLNYVFTDEDQVITGGDFIVKNLKMNKVKVIAQEVGVQPVLSFGNSTGDSSMAEYVTTNNPFKSLAFMLCCDDIERENGNVAKADKMYSLCEEFDWVPVSMKNDWKTIYGEGVYRTVSWTTPSSEQYAIDYWKSIFGNNTEVLSAEEIDAFNTANKTNGCGLVDLLAGKEYDAETVKAMIEDYSFPSKEYVHDRKITEKEKNEIMDNRNLDNSDFEVKYAITTENASIRAFPTDIFLTNEKNLYDYMQETGLNYGEPVIVLWESSDKEWYFVQAYDYNGWISKKSVGICTEEIFNLHINAYKDLENSVWCPKKTGEFEFTTLEGKNVTKFLRMGSYIPYVDGKLILIERDSDGNASYVFASMPQDYNGGILKFTTNNLLDLCEAALGTPYRWGDIDETGMDCSSTMQSIYRCFGMLLPRNSSQQIKVAADIVNLTELDKEDKFDTICNLPTGSILYMPGHVMMYLGTYEGVPYIIHNTTDSLSDDGVDIVFNSCVLTALTIGKSGNTLLDRVTYAVKY